MAQEWIKAGTGGLNQVLGVYADEKGKTLWVCSNNLENKGEATAAMAFDLKTGAPKGTYPLPGDGTLCNDIAVGGDGTTYVTDTRQGSVVMVKRGAKSLEIAAKDPLLAGADGLAFGDKTILYVNSVTAGKLVRLDLGPDGKAKSVTELKLSRPLDRPDGMRSIGKNRLLLAENSGKMSIVTFEGPELQNAVITTIKEGLESTPGVTATRGMAWIVEGKLNYRNDRGVQGQRSWPIQNVRGPVAKELKQRRCMRSAKCEREYLRSGIQELNFKSAVLYRVLLTDELVEAVIGNLSVSHASVSTP